MSEPPRLSLAAAPTPVQTLGSLAEGLTTPLQVKRDDLTGSHLSGNKIRKLEFLLAEALDQGATHVITCGGLQSNHCRATALAAAPLGLKPVILLRTPHGRGEDLPRPSRGNLLLNRLAGAEITLCDPDGYRGRDGRMAALADQIQRAGGRPYVIEEGGSNALGAWGYVLAAREIVTAMPEPPTTVFVPTGSGGTVAGLAIGFKQLGVPTLAVGVAVCDDRDTFRAIVHRISAEATARYGLPRLEEEDFDILDGHQGVGYALSTPDELRFLRDTLRREGLVLDPVYTAKALKGVVERLQRPDHPFGDRPLFIHTGGIFGLMAIGDQLDPILSHAPAGG